VFVKWLPRHSSSNRAAAMVAPLAFTSERMPERVATKAFGDWSGGGALRARGARALPPSRCTFFVYM